MELTKKATGQVISADLKYPKSEGYNITWLFDNSSCHHAYSQDALLAKHMNAKHGGKQPCMRVRGSFCHLEYSFLRVFSDTEISKFSHLLQKICDFGIHSSEYQCSGGTGVSLH